MGAVRAHTKQRNGRLERFIRSSGGFDPARRLRASTRAMSRLYRAASLRGGCMTPSPRRWGRSKTKAISVTINDPWSLASTRSGRRPPPSSGSSRPSWAPRGRRSRSVSSCASSLTGTSVRSSCTPVFCLERLRSHGACIRLARFKCRHDLPSGSQLRSEFPSGQRAWRLLTRVRRSGE